MAVSAQGCRCASGQPQQSRRLRLLAEHTRQGNPGGSCSRGVVCSTSAAAAAAAAGTDGGGAVLTAAHRHDMEERGYTVISDAADPRGLEAVVADIWARAQGMRRDDPSSWDPSHLGPELPAAGTALPDNRFGFQAIFHTPAMWRTRQSPRIHAAFSELWGTDKLWISLDRTMLKTPMQPGGTQSDLLHWDFDVRVEKRRFRLYQATLFLEDCAADQGTFQCVPGFHRKYEQWRASVSADELEAVMRTNRVPRTADFDSVAVPCKKGDLLIWDTFMPHGHTYNTTCDRCRLNQFMTMYPCTDKAAYRDALRVMWPNSAPSLDGSELGKHCGGLEAERQSRVKQWRIGCALDYPPEWPRYDFSSGWPESRLVPNGRDTPQCPLTQLGRRILGLELWPL